MNITERDIFSVIIGAICLFSWMIVAGSMVIYYIRHESANNKQIKTRFRIKHSWLYYISCHRMMKALSFFMVIITPIMLVFLILFSASLSSVLFSMWVMIIHISEFVFVSILTDDLGFKRNK